MITKKQSRVPGRPRRFAPEQAVSAAKVLFHQKGFDAVSVAEVTDYLGINPPSLYAAFGSKAGLFSRVLNEYVGTEAIPLADILRDDRPVGECPSPNNIGSRLNGSIVKSHTISLPKKILSNFMLKLINHKIGTELLYGTIGVSRPTLQYM